MSAISSETVRPSNGFTADDIIKAMLAPRARIDVWSHGCRISNFSAEIRTLMIELCRTTWGEYASVRVGRFRTEKKIKRVFVGTTKDRSVFHFHRNSLDFVLNRLGKLNVNRDRLEIIHHEMYEPVSVVHPVGDDRPPREIQLPIIEYLTTPPDPKYAPSKVVTLQTGKGKTFLSLYSLRKLSLRTMIVLQGRYVDKWIGDIEEAYGAEKGALMVIRGIPQLRGAIEMVRMGTFHPRVIIVSSKTMQMYLKHYETYGVDDYLPIAPTDLYKHFGIGVRLIDEVHQDFHCNFRQDLYTHVPLTISLSATLEPDQRFVEEMYRIVWPVGTWAPEMEYHKFIDVIALWYRFRNLSGIKWLNFMRQYNHTELEKSILKRPEVLRNYLDMIVDIVEKAFIEKMEKGQKMIVFVATVQMATLLADMLANLHPKLLVNRYVSEDEYEDLLSADISVSTLQSAGTAVDIPNLRVTLMTTALSSKQSNIQVLGRTRELKDWPDVTPEFYFLSSLDIDKHQQYAKEKKEKLAGKVLSFRDMRTNYVV
jgi:superfamily II DNA or RNA helicase